MQVGELYYTYTRRKVYVLVVCQTCKLDYFLGACVSEQPTCDKPACRTKAKQPKDAFRMKLRVLLVLASAAALPVSIESAVTRTLARLDAGDHRLRISVESPARRRSPPSRAAAQPLSRLQQQRRREKQLAIARMLAGRLEDRGNAVRVIFDSVGAAAAAQGQLQQPYDVLGLAMPVDALETLILVSPNNRASLTVQPEEHRHPCPAKLEAVQNLLCRARAPVVLIDPDLEALVLPNIERPVRPMLIADFELVATVG